MIMLIFIRTHTNSRFYYKIILLYLLSWNSDPKLPVRHRVVELSSLWHHVPSCIWCLFYAKYALNEMESMQFNDFPSYFAFFSNPRSYVLSCIRTIEFFHIDLLFIWWSFFVFPRILYILCSTSIETYGRIKMCLWEKKSCVRCYSK